MREPKCNKSMGNKPIQTRGGLDGFLPALARAVKKKSFFLSKPPRKAAFIVLFIFLLFIILFKWIDI